MGGQMRAHVIENNTVVDTIEVDSLDFIPDLIDGSIGGIGWVLEDGELRDPSAPNAKELLERQWQAVRVERNALLLSSDWTQLADAPVDAAVWAEYRQALRDITDQPDPFNIVWPTEPGA